MRYSLTKDGLIFDMDQQVYIPFDPANRDYAEYLRWLEEGNTPLPADEPEVSDGGQE